MSFPLLFSAPKQRAEAIGTRISRAIQLRHPIETTAHHAAATIGTLEGGESQQNHEITTRCPWYLVTGL